MKKWCLIAALLVLLSGCTGTTEQPEPQALSLVLGHHGAFPQTNGVLYADWIYEAAYSYGQVSAVISDGQPDLAVLVENQKPAKVVDETKHKQLAQTAVQTIQAQLAAAKATEAEIDLLRAIHVAVQALQTGGLQQQTLVIVDSGLSTAGLLDFSNSNLLDADPEAVVEALQDRQSVPDLTGIEVVFLGLGQTAGDQMKPDPEAQSKLKAIWTAVLQAGNPNSLVFDPIPLTGPEGADLPHCTPVAFVTEQLVLEQEDPIGEDPIRLSSVQFVSDSSEFLDRQAALEALTPVGEYLAAHPETKICLAGMTASTGGSGIDLSRQRAEACKSLLMEWGIWEEQVSCIGLGRTENFLRVNDLDADGNLMEQEAQKNRAVFLFRQNSETADRLGALINERVE